MGLFYSIEDEFGITIFDGDQGYRFFAIETLGELVELVSEQVC
jgi:acyl carrier protein